jgi:hypothetical protein
MIPVMELDMMDRVRALRRDALRFSLTRALTVTDSIG